MLCMGTLPMVWHITLDHLTEPILLTMSKHSIQKCVEWGFGKICLTFAYLDFKKNLKVLLQPVGKYYLVVC